MPHWYDGPLEWLPHALDQIAERRLDRRMVEEALRSPDQIVAAQEGRFAAHKWTTTPRRLRRALLRVIFEERPDRRLIVTAFLTDRPHRYWEGPMP
ncbi:MAG TPA: DUF4258 domain-containing protein [Alphaproteobacteria bacterium]|nr:DUF4258 domain-containing protein [Alphaproteobacteria bacterium]